MNLSNARIAPVKRRQRWHELPANIRSPSGPCSRAGARKSPRRRPIGHHPRAWHIERPKILGMCCTTGLNRNVPKSQVKGTRAIAIFLPPGKQRWIPIADQGIPVVNPLSRIVPAARHYAKCDDEAYAGGDLRRRDRAPLKPLPHEGAKNRRQHQKGAGFGQECPPGTDQVRCTASRPGALVSTLAGSARRRC